MADPAVPMMADCVSPPAANPAARPLLRFAALAHTTTVARAVTARQAVRTISRRDFRFRERKNWGPHS